MSRDSGDGDADFGILRRDEDLLATIEQGIRERRMGDAVRLQYDPELPKEIVGQLVEELELGVEDLYPGTGFTAFTDLFQLYAAINAPRLKDRPQSPLAISALDARRTSGAPYAAATSWYFIPTRPSMP